MSYFCTQCKRKHHSGKIYKKHKHLQKIEKETIPYKKVLRCNWNFLPPIAQRQITHYIDKILLDKKLNYSSHIELYVQEINRVILHYDNETPIIL